MQKRTKIVATISDLRCSEEFLSTLFKAGVNVVRMNTAHMSKEGITEIITRTRKLDNSIAVLLDTKGPEVRTTKLKAQVQKDEECEAKGVKSSNVKIQIEKGSEVVFAANVDELSDEQVVNVNYTGFVKDVPVGAVILVDDGKVSFQVTKKEDNKLYTIAQNTGALGSKKSVNVPGVRIDLPAVTEKDRGNILHAAPQGLDFIAHSFVRSKEDIEEVRAILKEVNVNDVKIISKIENQEGIDRIDEIIEASDGIMIARGDLAIEVPAEIVPTYQRMIIRKCLDAKKPVIVATQMLETMQENPLPTRAEVSDVANAVYNRTDAVMLSGETANGAYPVEAVEMMARIVVATEENLGSKMGEGEMALSEQVTTTTAFLAKQAVKSVGVIDTEVIVTDSFTGRTARYLSSFRANVPVCAICSTAKLARQLSLNYGIVAFSGDESMTDKERLHAGFKYFEEMGILNAQTQVAYMSGTMGVTGAAHGLEIETVEKLLERH